MWLRGAPLACQGVAWVGAIKTERRRAGSGGSSEQQHGVATQVMHELLRKARRGDVDDAFTRLVACGADDELIVLTKECLAPEPQVGRGSRPPYFAGHAFDRRFNSVVLVDEPHFLELARYIALNPVRAGLCRLPGDWPWSSYTANAGAIRPPDFLDVAFIRALLTRRIAASIPFRRGITTSIRMNRARNHRA